MPLPQVEATIEEQKGQVAAGNKQQAAWVPTAAQQQALAQLHAAGIAGQQSMAQLLAMAAASYAGLAALMCGLQDGIPPQMLPQLQGSTAGALARPATTRPASHAAAGCAAAARWRGCCAEPPTTLTACIHAPCTAAAASLPQAEAW